MTFCLHLALFSVFSVGEDAALDNFLAWIRRASLVTKPNEGMARNVWQPSAHVPSITEIKQSKN